MSVRDMPVAWPSVIHMLTQTAKRFPKETAIVCGEKRLTYSEYHRCIAALAAEFRQAGIGTGDRIALLMGNSADIAVAIFAVQATGAQVVPLNPAYTAAELGPVLADADVALLVHDAGLEPVFSAILPAGTATLCVGPSARDLTVPGSPASATLPLPDPGTLSTLQYTGGTTGAAKGVDLTHAAIAINIAQREALLPTVAQERILAITPLFHIYAVSMGLYLAANCGGMLVIVPKFTAHGVLQDIAEHRISFLSASPTIFQALMRDEGFGRADLSSLRVCSSGSAALAADVLTRWERATGAVIFEGYGQTEAGPVLTYNPLQGARLPGTVGIAAPATEISIVDVETGSTALPLDADGEIRARGPQIMAGYRNCPAETAQALRDGWLYTGDIGRLTATGHLVICDRKKDMVVTSGYNVFPREIEEVLFALPGVADAAIIGVPDAYRGEVLHAFVVRADPALTEADIRAHIATQLTKYKWPRDIDFVAALPKTIIGKTDKKKMRKQVPAGLAQNSPVHAGRR
jgi:long-chain acyl-CoA synthetase